MRVRTLLPAAAVVIAAQASLVACGESAEVARVRPWVTDVPYLPPREPESASAQTASTDAPAPKAKQATAPKARSAAPAAEAEPQDLGAPSDAEVAAELREAYKGSSGRDIVDSATVVSGGLASVPVSAPSKVAAIISAANQVARKPYVYGGGHGGGPEGTFSDSAYDCSGSMSYALAAAGLLDSPMDSTSFSKWGKPGPGKWVTIYANAGHAFMYVAGLRFDTSALRQGGSRWGSASRSVGGFTVRHPAGL